MAAAEQATRPQILRTVGDSFFDDGREPGHEVSGGKGTANVADSRLLPGNVQAGPGTLANQPPHRRHEPYQSITSTPSEQPRKQPDSNRPRDARELCISALMGLLLLGAALGILVLLGVSIFSESRRPLRAVESELPTFQTGTNNCTNHSHNADGVIDGDHTSTSLQAGLEEERAYDDAPFVTEALHETTTRLSPNTYETRNVFLDLKTRPALKIPEESVYSSERADKPKGVGPERHSKMSVAMAMFTEDRNQTQMSEEE